MRSIFVFTLICFCTCLKFNSNYEKRFQSQEQVELGPTEADNGHSSWSLGGGGCHSVFAQQGFTRGFRNAIHSDTIFFNYPIYQVTVSGGGWFWAGLLSYAKYFKATESELYGMDGFGWLNVVAANCEPSVDDNCSLSGGAGSDGTGTGNGSGCGYFFHEGHVSLLEQASEVSSQGGGHGLEACETESAVDSKCTRQQKIAIFGPAATCANSMGFQPAPAASWLENTYKHYLEPNGLRWTDTWSDFGSIDDSSISFSWRLSWSNFSYLSDPPSYRVAGCFAHHDTHWSTSDPTSVVTGISRSSNALAAILSNVMMYLKIPGCRQINKDYIEEQGETVSSTLEMLHDFLPETLTFNKNAGEHFSTLFEIPYSMALAFDSDKRYTDCANACSGSATAIATCKTACHTSHPNGNPTDNINDQAGLLNLLATIEEMETTGITITTGSSSITTERRHYFETWGTNLHGRRRGVTETANNGAQTNTDGTNGQYGAFRVFPVVLMTATGLTSKSLFTAAFNLVRQYYAPTGTTTNSYIFKQSEVPPHVLGLHHFLCGYPWLNDNNNDQGHTNENHGITIPSTSGFWGISPTTGAACASYMFLLSPPTDVPILTASSVPPLPTGADPAPFNPPQCDNLYSKLKRTGLLYAEKVDVANNPKFNFGAIDYPWKIMAIAMAVQVENDMSVQWLVFADPYAAMVAGTRFRQAAARKLGISGSGSGSPVGMFFAESQLQTIPVHPPFRDNVASDGNDDWVQLNMANLRQDAQTDSVGFAPITVTSFLLAHFPAFPATTLQYLPPKFAYILDNYMSHVSYIMQCCYNKWKSPYCVDHTNTPLPALAATPCPTLTDACPFCASFSNLCPCQAITASIAASDNSLWTASGWLGPTQSFVFPVARFGVSHSESR